MLKTIGLLAAGLLALHTAKASAQVPAGDPAAGLRFAAAGCSDCHAVDGPARPGQRGPAFPAIARLSSTTTMSLHAFLLTPHPHMPNYRLSQTEVDDVVAYILSLKGK